MKPSKNKLSTRTKTALWLMIAPSALFIVTFISFALANWAFSASIGSDGVTDAQSPAIVIVNIVLFITGLVSIVSWLPGLIVGIILLVTKK